MTLILPQGVGEAAMRAALASFAAIVGARWYFGPDHERLSSYDDAYPVDDPGRFAPAAALAPANVEQIQAILKVANASRVPLWTVSGGRNYAYGGATPRVRGSVVVDLSRMNRILEVDEASAYCVVEPGVTYFQLYEHLQKNKIKLWLSPPEPGWASVMGNALDHGVGYTPMGDNFGFQCGMEVVLADGDIVRTGMGAMAKSNSWQLFKYGFGPVLDGIFSQSNFGIVTKMGLWLMPEPPAYRSYMISFPKESDLAAAIEILRPLRVSNIIQNCGMLTSWVYEASLTGPRTDYWKGAGPIPESAKQATIDKMGIGYWNLYAAQYGTPSIIDEYWNIIRSAFSHIPGVKFQLASERPDLVGLQLRDLLGKGVPNMATFNVLNWIPNAGHIDFSPVSPSTGKDTSWLYQLLKEETEAAGFDYIGAFIMGWREMHNVVLILYDKSDPAQQARVRAMFGRLVQRAAAQGYGEYRTHIAFMDEVARTFDFNEHAMLRLSERIKDAIDPNGILAPGKSGIWPRRLREERK